MRTAVATTTTTKTATATTIPMEHSSTSRRRQSSMELHAISSSSTALSSSSVSQAVSLEDDERSRVAVVPIQARQTPVPRPDESNLFEIPLELHPTYRPLPALAKVASAIFSAFVAASTTTWPSDQFINSAAATTRWLYAPLLSLRANRLRFWQKALEFVFKGMVTWLVTNIAAQELFLSPSRISSAELAASYFLPSALSQYEPLPVFPIDQNFSVHWIEYHHHRCSSTNTSSFPFSAIYVNHGFGASSLSWLPALPPLVEKLGARFGLGHDAPGFGFTDRPQTIDSFTPQASSSIASYLLQSKLSLQHQQQQQQQQQLQNESVILFGHSMGSITTLNMALSLPKEIAKEIVLVAPALGVSPQSNRAIQVQFPKLCQPAMRLIGQVVVDPPATFLLKRLVGSKNFWKQGLRTVWGQPSRVSDSDVLRFQWPSIGLGWEKGLLSFTRAQLSIKADLTDRLLLEKVLALPNTRVTVILGSSDKVMPTNAVRNFFKPYANISIIELDGQGHDPFEEDVDLFVQTVKNALQPYYY